MQVASAFQMLLAIACTSKRQLQLLERITESVILFDKNQNLHSKPCHLGVETGPVYTCSEATPASHTCSF